MTKASDSNYFKDKVRPVGESQVWLCSMALAVGILMVVGMLGLIFWQGVQVFWPKDITFVQLSEETPEEYRIKGELQFAGALIKKQSIVDHSLGKEHQETADEDWQFFVANKDAYGFSYKYFNERYIASTDKPQDIVVAERFSWGHAIFYPQSITFPEGKVIHVSEDEKTFMQVFKTEVQASAERWKQIRKVEVDQISPLSQKIRDISDSLNQAQLEGNAERIARLEARRADLMADEQELKNWATQLRDQQEAISLAVKLPTGEVRNYALGQIVGFFQPNQMNVLQKLGHMLKHLWYFLSENPRESNTEGGIFPAIFGTFVMTVLMSAAVMPFGVLAAIYLREYAKQGPFLRSVRIAINNLAGVPSIVFGVFGLGFFIYGVGSWIDDIFFGEELVFGKGGVLWASLTLALLTVPVVIVATEEALVAVTRGMREASLACGASKWQTIQRVVLPAAAPGILTGLILAMARGAGEVAPLMLVGVVKNAVNLPFDSAPPFIHLERQFMHLGFHIYDLGFQSPDSEAARPMVFATTFLLILLVLVLNLGAIIIRNHLRRKYAGSAF